MEHLLSYISEYQFWACQKNFNFRWERQDSGSPRLASPLSFSFLPEWPDHSSGPGQRTPPACSQMHGAGNKINLVAIVFPPVWWPRVSSSVTAGKGIKKSKLGCAKNYDSIGEVDVCVCVCVGGVYMNRAELMADYEVKTRSISVRE